MKDGEILARRARELHARGLTYREIADELRPMSRMTAWRLVNGSHDGPGTGPRQTRPGRTQMKPPKVVGDGPDFPDVDPDDKDEIIRRLRLENDVLRGMHEVLKGRALGSLTNREKALLINWLRANAKWSLKELTSFLGISKSSYEYQRRALEAGDRYAWLRPLVAEEFEAEGGLRGYRVVTHRLRMRETPVVVSEKVVRRIMGEDGLVVRRGKRRRRYNSYAGELGDRPPNLPLREDGTHDFRADSPGRKLVTDVTEFRLPDAPKHYLAPVIDLYDGKPLGWCISQRPDAELANRALLMACDRLEPGRPVFCHSDSGCHYFWPGWVAICEEHGIQRSMSRKGRSGDNAAAEGFFGILKSEFYYPRDWTGVTSEEFVAALDQWMREYSSKRLKAFREEGKVVYDTIDGRRRRLGHSS